MYLISLIIPIYNAENYLETTINSIINQTIGFDNIELILVDDFSTDNSKNIIKKYAEKYDNIIPFYSNENHGFPGFGRNVGLEKSTAEYIMFMDNDDEIDKDICKKLYEAITNENADVACCDTHIIDPISEIKKNISYVNGNKKGNFIVIEDDNILLFDNISVWNKIYKKSIIDENDVRFEENTYADDMIFSLSYYLKSRKMIYLKDYFGYKWIIRSKSLSHSVKKEHILKLISAYNIVINMFEKESKFDFAKKILINHIGFLLIQSSYLDASKKEIEGILKEIHDFETKLAPIKLNGLWLNTANQLVLHENYTMARIYLKTTDKIRKFDFLRKISRKTK